MRKIAFFLSLWTALAVAAHAQEVFDLIGKGDVPAVKALIEKTPDLIRSLDPNGNSLLHYAAHRGDADLIRFLIDKGISPDLVGAGKKTPLHLAATFNQKEAVAALLERKAALETRDDYGRTALILCARERGQAETGRILIEAGRTSTPRTDSNPQPSNWRPGEASATSSTFSWKRAPRFRNRARNGTSCSRRPRPGDWKSSSGRWPARSAI